MTADYTGTSTELKREHGLFHENGDFHRDACVWNWHLAVRWYVKRLVFCSEFKAKLEQIFFFLFKKETVHFAHAILLILEMAWETNTLLNILISFKI